MEYYTKNGLKTNGWTEAMIKDLLGEADLYYPQQCGRMRPRYYYLASKVEAIEKTKAFEERKRAKAAR